ncbi:Tryptophan-associated transmembrane protein [Corynebacterium occultum]|uniref:Tryptophan-associated transmembrane protein n=1 Tax=Corynebacterium occultum TaxID=2675219 RepID=A0A6B8W747_9CORY|nr:TIGR02234 family membrane protein [Corynebacterium occultum]QGU07747.1 Tryptophan-associated transmembrane protein [Corynebacterium occultum]
MSTTTAPDRRNSRIAALLLGLGALVLWGASRMSWLRVEAFDDKSGALSHDIVGATWSTEATAVTLLLLAACVAGFALRRIGRRVVGIVGALAAVGASWAPLNLLAGEPDAERARTILTSAQSSQRASDTAVLSEWAELVDLQVLSSGPVVAMIGCALALFGGVMLAVKPGQDSAQLNKYERKRNREARIVDDLKSTPDSGRVMWDALDADIDPTDDLPGEKPRGN